jgi:restriction system protein
MSKEQPMWMVRAGEGAYLIYEFLNQNLVAIGWNSVGNLKEVKGLKDIKEKLKKAYPDFKDSQINNFAGQLQRFRFEFQKGQKVVTYAPNERQYHIGEIISDYDYSQTEAEFHHFRKISWLNKISRDSLSTSAKNSLGSTLTIFKIPYEIEEELLKTKKAPSSIDEKAIDLEEETLDTLKEDTEAKAKEFIKDKILSLNWEEFQEYIAGILRAMGYRTLVSSKGSDRGKDIVGSPDGLGLESPRIKVECKHRKGTMGAPEVREFMAVLRGVDKGLYISTGGFTREAHYEAERSEKPLTLVDSEMLVNLTILHYDNFDSESRALIPLKKIYWPA